MRIHVQPKFPWAQAAEKRNEVLIAQPQRALYIVGPPEGPTADYNSYVPSMKSELPFTGSIIEFMVDALYGDPAEFPFEAYLVLA